MEANAGQRDEEFVGIRSESSHAAAVSSCHTRASTTALLLLLLCSEDFVLKSCLQVHANAVFLCCFLCWVFSTWDVDLQQPKAAAVRPLMNGTICQICGDDVGVSLPEGELFVACNACAFPVCRPCYEYERKDGTQSCPQCRKRYIRHRGQSV
jgi:hypothetical protein